MSPFHFERIALKDEVRIGDEFCVKHGTPPHGLISDEEFDRLFDHLLAVLAKHGTVTEQGHGDSDFVLDRYIDQVPYIGVVPPDRLSPRTALLAGLEAVETAPAPMGVSFDFFPKNRLVVLPERRVLATYRRDEME